MRLHSQYDLGPRQRIESEKFPHIQLRLIRTQSLVKNGVKELYSSRARKFKACQDAVDEK